MQTDSADRSKKIDESQKARLKAKRPEAGGRDFFEQDIEENQNVHPHTYETVRQLFRLIGKHMRIISYGVLMILLGTAMVLLEPRLFGYAIDEAILPKRWTLLQELVFAYFLVTCLRVFSAVKQAYLFELLGQKVTQELRVMLFKHLHRLPATVYDRNPAGRLLTRVTNDVAAISEMFSGGFVAMAFNLLLVMGILGWLIYLDPRLGLIAASVLPGLVVISVYFSKKLKVAYREARNRLSSLNSFLAENFSGMKTVHLFNRQKRHLERFDHLNERYAVAQTASTQVFALFQPTITVASGISVALVIWFGGHEVLDGQLKLGMLVVYFSYILSLYQPIREIADKWNTFLSGIASAERVFSILNWEPEVQLGSVSKPAQQIEGLRGEIVFENVWFAYEGENWVLKDFSLSIKAGEKIGLVGHTGAGKSSLISLLMRFYEPQKGRILLDGRDIREYDKRSLRASLGLVQQDVFLFSGSFEENITFWDESKRPQMERVLQSFSFRPRLGSTPMQERGGNLSGGERQVLAFARAATAQPRVWILDEATSSMDSDREHHLQHVLESMSAANTAIVIAHRLATIRSMDRIVVLHKGCLVECGNHDALMKRDGLYARLHRYQLSTV